MKIIAGILTITVMVLLSCRVEGEPSEDGPGASFDGTLTLTGAVAGVHADWDEISASFDGGGTWAVTAPISNGKFTLTLPVPGAQYFNYVFADIPDGITASAKNVKGCEAYFYAREGSQSEQLYLTGSSSKGVFKALYFYVDNNINITGTYTDTKDKYSEVYDDVTLKKGWNTIVEYEEIISGITTFTYTTEPIPTGAVWKCETGKMTLTGQGSGDKTIYLTGTGTAIINWGDNSASETKALASTYAPYKHSYSGTTAHTITIKGDNITILGCPENQLTSLDVSKNTALKELYCWDNELTSLDVSKNIALTELDCSSNQLISLDVTKSTALKELYCWDNELTSLDVSKNIALTNLDCFINQLTSLDVSKNIALTELDCEYNLLTAVGLNALFGTLHGNTVTGGKTILIAGNPGTSSCDRSIATAKGWTVEPPLILPALTTNAVTDITTAAATLGGNITDTGMPGYTERGVVYATSTNPTTADNKTPVAGTGAGNFTVSVTGLSEGTTYYVRAYAINTQGTAYGTQVSFTTTKLPVLSTLEATGIAVTTATLGGNITHAGTPTYTERGVVYAASTNPTTANNKMVITGTGTGNYTKAVTGLSENTTYYVRAYAINTQGTAYGAQVSFTTAKYPVLSTLVVTDITATTATLGGSITDTGTPEYTERGVVYATSSNPTTANNKAQVDGTGTGNFTVPVTGLASGTTYYVRAYAIGTQGTAYGTQVYFTTAKLPVLSTLAATGITDNAATLGGNITDTGIPAYTERGVVYATSANPTIADNKTPVVGTGTGNFTAPVTGLSEGTTYYVRAYAINTQGTVYGTQASFTTTKLPGLSTLEATGVAATAATLGGNITDAGTPGFTERGVVYATSTNPTTANNKTVITGTGTGNYTKAVTGLSENTTYYVRAYAINAQGTAYGAQVSFTTLKLPVLYTLAATDITINGATLGGNITDTGIPAYTERGVVYATSSNPTTANNKTQVAGAGIGNFTVPVTGLTSGTTYYVRAYAIGTQGTAYGTQVSFTTLKLPVLSTLAASGITTTTATLGGNITNAGTPAYTERGVCYSTAQNPTTSDTKLIVSGSGIGNFTVPVAGLSEGTTYYVRAYAINSQGTAYGSQVSFKTDYRTYILDDGSDESGWRANSANTGNYWMGNQFTVGESGELTSIDVYGINSTDNKNSPVYIDIYDQSRTLVGSSASFVLPSDAWKNVPVNNLPYSGTFYVMVRWPAGSYTHYLGIDTNGSKAQANLNWTLNSLEVWNLLHNNNPDKPTARGVFMIRAKAKTTAAKSVTYGAGPQIKVTRASAGTAAGTAECSN